MSFSVAVDVRKKHWKLSEYLLQNPKLHAFKEIFVEINKCIHTYSGFPLPLSQRQNNYSVLYPVNKILYRM